MESNIQQNQIEDYIKAYYPSCEVQVAHKPIKRKTHTIDTIVNNVKYRYVALPYRSDEPTTVSYHEITPEQEEEFDKRQSLMDAIKSRIIKQKELANC